jgi:hypothetical protein
VPTAGADIERPLPGVTPGTQLEQSAVAVETWEMDAETSTDAVTLAETALARLLVKLWRARQAGPLPGTRVGTDFGAN